MWIIFGLEYVECMGVLTRQISAWSWLGHYFNILDSFVNVNGVYILVGLCLRRTIWSQLPRFCPIQFATDLWWKFTNETYPVSLWSRYLSTLSMAFFPGISLPAESRTVSRQQLHANSPTVGSSTINPAWKRQASLWFSLPVYGPRQLIQVLPSRIGAGFTFIVLPLKNRIG